MTSIREHIVALALAGAAVSLLAVSLACGAGPAKAREPETPPQDSGCNKDSDCKGERICESGKCVASPK